MTALTAGIEELDEALPQFTKSSLTGNPAKLVKTFKTDPIIRLYRERFEYDASRDFHGLSEIGLYQDETGFRFWYPLNLAGPEALYRTLEKFDFNYQEGKWEHVHALRYVGPDVKVLDVGCGEGAFLNMARKAGAVVTGLELNKSAAAKAASKGIEICPELSGAHALQRPDHYDVVASFQVLEHVSDPKGFIQSLLDCLKPGGTLIIGVPNCDSFQVNDDTNILNQPPHHVGWWNRKSLSALAGQFPMEMTTFEVATLADEPLVGWYCAVQRGRFAKGWLMTKLYNKFLYKPFQKFVEDNAHTIAAHTILAVYRKS